MIKVTAFDTVDEFAKHIEDVRESAVELNDHKVLDLATGDHNTYWVNMTHATSYDLIIFCEVLGKNEFLKQQDEDSDASPNYYLNLWNDQAHTGFLFSRCYSVVEPRGEYGDTHTSRLTWQLTPMEWLVAKECQWNVINPDGQLSPIGIILAQKEADYAKQEKE
jgi:hypothetical protein